MVELLRLSVAGDGRAKDDAAARPPPPLIHEYFFERPPRASDAVALAARCRTSSVWPCLASRSRSFFVIGLIVSGAGATPPGVAVAPSVAPTFGLLGSAVALAPEVEDAARRRFSLAAMRASSCARSRWAMLPRAV